MVQSLFQEKRNLKDIDIEVAHRIGPYKNIDNTVNSKRPVIWKMLRPTDIMKVIAVREKLKGQKLSISDELTKYNFDLLKNLQDHDIIDQA